MRRQEMEIDECRKLLLDKALQINVPNAQRFVDHIISHRLPAEIRQYSSASIQQLRSLFSDYLEAHPPRQEIDIEEYRKLLLYKTLHIDSRNAQRFVDYIVSNKSPAEIVLFSSGSIQQLRSLFREVMTYLEAHPPIFQQLPLKKPPSWGHGHGLQFPQPQLYPSLSFHGIHAPSTPIGPTGAFQSPSPEFTGSGELMLEKEIRELLFLLQPPSLQVESLANMYMDRYGKPLQNEGLLIDGQQQGKAGRNLTDLLMRLNTTRVVERDGHQYIVPVEDAPMYLAHGFNLGMPPASSNSNKIFVVFMPGSKFTEEDVHSYFSQYGTVNDVRIPPQGRHKYGFVSFQGPGTAKRILSERVPRFICGDPVLVEEYKEKHELDFRRERHHGFESVLPSARIGSNRIFITFDPESSFTKNDAWKYFSHYGPVNDVRKKHKFGYVSFKYPETVKQILSERCLRTSHFICGDHVFVEPYKEKHGPEMLAREVADFVLEPHEVSDVDVIHKHHTEKELLSNQDFYGEKLNKGRDQGIVTEKSNTNVAPVMASPPTRNLSVHSVSEASPSQGHTESSHVLNHLDDASADLDSHGLRLPETLDDVF